MQITPPNACAITKVIQRGYNAPSWTTVLKEGVASSDHSTPPVPVVGPASIR